MAYQSKDLSVLAYANGFTLWHYATNDTAAEVDTSDYFDGDASEMLRVGDIVIANVDQDGTPQAGLYLVRDITSGVVDVTDMTQVGAANTD